eukprot:Protomagalhaensia_wolfi_Nauph_80__4178@NODE_424_length_2545_cov_30_204709_g317_i0_p1_GENE_NODE_424_length_2545_cov_30_204709_g317_i0NODE_424_length_2545_cov_30_204709_g317_i0_p1_ORF_typecomplete_len294_score57_88_NODE_424_length_2545_cov_30_204709_g317_i03191200
MRKYVKKEYMVTERDQQGCLSGIIYDERRKITLGKEGRESLRTQLRRLHDRHAGKMDDLLEKHGFKYSELRNATVQQLSRMAYVCNLWDKVVAACRKQEEKRDCRNRDTGLKPKRETEAETPPSTSSRREPLEPWKVFPQNPYGDLQSHAYSTAESFRDQPAAPDPFPLAASLCAEATTPLASIPGVRVKQELPEPNPNGSSAMVNEKGPSIEDLLSTLSVNWDCPTNEPIEQFLRTQQERQDGEPVTEDNIFQAFSELVPSISVPGPVDRDWKRPGGHNFNFFPGEESNEQV